MALEKYVGKIRVAAKANVVVLELFIIIFLKICSYGLLTIYDKDEASDLTASQKKMLKTAIDSEKQTRAKARRKR